VAAALLTADTSVVVPALIQWHALHVQAAVRLRDVRRLPGHALAEAFSVLTRLPMPRALTPLQASQALLHSFPEESLSLSPAGYATTMRRLADAGLGGGRIYDAIVAAAAAEAGARLLTADRRAIPTYALVGAEFELVE
jgi:predicted nucleic acid-binding protein